MSDDRRRDAGTVPPDEVIDVDDIPLPEVSDERLYDGPAAPPQVPAGPVAAGDRRVV